MKKIVVLVVAVCVMLVGSTSGLAVENQIENFIALCENGSVEEFEEAIREFGVDSPLSDNNETPLLVATRRDMLGIVRRLIDMGAEVNLTNNFNISPLMYAAVNRNPKMIQYLLEHGADVTMRGNSTHDPILCIMYTINGFAHRTTAKLPVAYQDDYGTFKVLIKNGAKITDICDTGDNMLHFALTMGANMNFVKALLDLDLEGFKEALTMRNNQGVTPLSLLKRRGIAEELREFLNKLVGRTMLNPYE